MEFQSSGFGEEQTAFRQTLRRFVDQHIAPYVDEWDESEAFPRALYPAAADVGLLGLGFPEALGGTEGDAFHTIVACQELARPGSGGVGAGLSSHTIALPPILHLGTAAQKERFIPPTLRGEKIAALAVTEPSGGSDVAELTTRAERSGDDFLLSGTKVFITSGMRADLLTIAARTGGPGKDGISIFAVETDRPGISRTSLKKMGWWASDTATIHFDECRVPAENLIGVENQGFFGLMLNFSRERFHLAASAIGYAHTCYMEALEWAQNRRTFGKPLIQRQVIRHKFVDMATQLTASFALLERVAHQLNAEENPIAEICMLKNLATQTLELCAKESVQILGGAGYIRGAKCERIYRETKVVAIGGGAEEIMKDLASRQLGL